MNPYLPIRKVPLDYNGIHSSAYAVQMQHPDKSTEDGLINGHSAPDFSAIFTTRLHFTLPSIQLSGALFALGREGDGRPFQ